MYNEHTDQNTIYLFLQRYQKILQDDFRPSILEYATY